MYFVLGVILVLNLTLEESEAARILSIAFSGSKSHKISYEPVLIALARRGHSVTVVSYDPPKQNMTNMREIFTFDVNSRFSMPNMFEAKQKKEKMDLSKLKPIMVNACRQSLELPQVKALQSEAFDLIFVPAALNECAAAFAYTFNTSLIFISPFTVPSVISSLYGNPSPVSFVPNVFTGYTDKMSFYERILNFRAEVMFRLVYDYYLRPAVEVVYREKLGQQTPSANEIYKSSSLIFSNSYFSITTLRPFLPDIIEVGGMHCHPPLPLPKDLEDFVNSSGENGFIFFSMGSILKGSDMPEEKRKIFLSVFSKLSQKVLWKWDAEMTDLPENVKLSKWLPQQDVLGHPKIKLFITHGGFGSTTEAVYHGVPLVGIPIFADQSMNVDIAEKAGYAITLDFNTITEDNFLHAINQVLTLPKYKESVTSLSRILRDQPEKPLDRAVFWSEYVIRHKGAHHLRSAARDLNFFQYHSIDAIGALLAILISTLFIFVKILKIVLRKFVNRLGLISTTKKIN